MLYREGDITFHNDGFLRTDAGDLCEKMLLEQIIEAKNDRDFQTPTNKKVHH